MKSAAASGLATQSGGNVGCVTSETYSVLAGGSLRRVARLSVRGSRRRPEIPTPDMTNSRSTAAVWKYARLRGNEIS
jgi:hypothetical protein